MGKSQIIITTILFFIFFIAFIIAIISFMRQYQLKKKEHILIIQKQQIEHQQELMSTKIEIQNQTMQHIGREIHDNIGQKLTLASLYAQQLAYENKAPHINENIENISLIINESLSVLRQLSKSLTDDYINSLSIIELIQQECDKINSLKKCKVIFETNSKSIDLSYEVKSVLYRIIQEFIQNSIKYSGCKKIMIQLLLSNLQTELLLEDDGKGFDVNSKNSTGIGLINMKKRAEIIKSTFTIESNNKGTKVTLKIPLKNE